MPNFRNSQLYPIVLTLVSMVSLTTGASIAKSLFPILGAAGTTVLRLGIAAILLSALWSPWRAQITRAQFRAIAAYGVCIGAMNLMFYFAIARLPLGIAIAIEFLGPLSVALLLSRKPSDFVWALLALTGIVLVLPLAGFEQPIDLVGVAFALGAAGAWALYIVLGQQVGARTHNSVHPGAVTAIGMTAGFAAIIPFGIGPIAPLFSHPALWPAALAVGLLSSAIPYSCEMVALKKISAKNFGILLSLEPAIGAVMGFAFLAERLSAIQVAAIVCIMVASVGSSRSARKNQIVVRD